MKFDMNKVYTALNATQVKIGSKVYAAPNVEDLKKAVKSNMTADLRVVVEIKNESYAHRFVTETSDKSAKLSYPLCYVVEEPAEGRCTYGELAQWVAKGYGVWSFGGAQSSRSVFTELTFISYDWDEPVPDGDYVIRKWDDKEWHKPTKDYMGLST